MTEGQYSPGTFDVDSHITIITLLFDFFSLYFKPLINFSSIKMKSVPKDILNLIPNYRLEMLTFCNLMGLLCCQYCVISPRKALCTGRTCKHARKNVIPWIHWDWFQQTNCVLQLWATAVWRFENVLTDAVRSDWFGRSWEKRRGISLAETHPHGFPCFRLRPLLILKTSVSSEAEQTKTQFYFILLWFRPQVQTG